MNRLGQLLRNKRLRQVVAVVVIAATLGIFTYYLATHPETLQSLASLSPATLALLSVFYVGTVIANAFVLWTSLRMIGKKVGFAENIALTGYSSVVNFFGPLQSGPGFRAAYLKQRHGISFKKFLYATMVFYGFFGFMNGLVIVAAIIGRADSSRALLLAVSALLTLTSATFLAYRFIPKVRELVRAVKLNDRNFWYIGVGALVLSAATTAAYHAELTHVESSISIMQTIVYAAAANLALFVSLTPGAIGFRESFLLLSQQLHGISTDVVVAASIIDRAFYVVFLLVLFVVLLLIGARAKLQKTESN